MTPEFPVDQIIVSANEHWLYLPFWPLVAYAYKTLFPGVRVRLVFVSERREDDPFVTELRTHGEVVLQRPVNNIPQAAQTKLARYYIAAQQGSDVCYIDDIDWIPIDAEWHAKKVRARARGSLLLVGSEVYSGTEEGQVPASQMTAEGDVFRKLFNPDNIPYGAWIYRLGGKTGTHEDVLSRANHEGMDSTTAQDHLKQPLFSDEALIMSLRKRHPVPVTHVERGYEPGVDTLDRSAWLAFDQAKLDSGGYLGAHTGRPYSAHKAGNDAILEHLRKRYGGGPLPAPLAPKTPKVDADMTFGGSGMTQEAFEWVCENIPSGSIIFEFGSGHVSTNYLSRYYFMVSVESDLKFANLYPSHYIYAPLVKGWYDVERLAYGLTHRRLWERPAPALTIIDGPIGDRSRVLEYTALLHLEKPILVDDVDREEEHQMAQTLAKRAGIPLHVKGTFGIV